ncbi:MAG: ABC transporter permease, partial [Patescibacteria group bacterium]|nr:ABC transporter permease [Patescibacteria group bacterium]
MTDDNITIIKPRKTFSFDDFKEIWKYRELLYFFTWRDLKVRYKQTAIGVAWAVFQPFMAMVVFSVFFGKLAGMPSDDIPYPIFVFVGLLLWQFFSGSLTQISQCFVGHKAIITKVYFPRIILPISAIFTKFIDFAIASIILVGLMFYYGYAPHLSGLFILPLLLIITFTAALGLGLFLASLNVKYRDVGYILPFFIQLGLFVTPVIYPSSITGIYSWFLAMNPMAGVI